MGPFYCFNSLPMSAEHIKNIAVIAHIDHGKTTLVDALLKQTHVFRDNQQEMFQERILDQDGLEQERGITILAKNCSISSGDYKINIIDTPGHVDFSGEVERTLGMADGALLIIDAQEGPMPQTRFVLKKALELGLKIIVVVNKIDKPFAQIDQVIKKTGDLFLELAQTEEQLDFPVLYAVGRQGVVFDQPPQNLKQPGSIQPLINAIIKHIPSPQANSQASFQMLVSSLDYDPHLGLIVIGRIHQGSIKSGQKVIINSESTSHTIEKVMVFQGLDKQEVKQAKAGEIVALSGLKHIRIGSTLSDPLNPATLSAPTIGEPTLNFTLGVNTSPFAGKEGQFSTSRQIQERLYQELETNLSLKVKPLDNGKFQISGRGELHLSVLLETLRREGYEMEVGQPQVIIKTVDGVKQEPFEEVSIIVPQTYTGAINQELGKRLAKLIKMDNISDNEVEFIYHIPTRAVIGLRNILLTQTKGTVVFNSQILGFQPLGQSLSKFRSGALISNTTGEVLAYGLHAAQQRGITFIKPGEQVYEGMVIGQNAKEADLEINVCKGKKLTNMRSKSSDGIIQLTPPTVFSLEQSLNFLQSDELLEITPKSLRLRKKHLTDIERRRDRRTH